VAAGQAGADGESSGIIGALIRRATYRFVCIYLGLFAVASQFLGGLILFPGFSFPPLGTVWPLRPITEWLGRHVFHVSTLAVAGTSADTPFHWVQLSWIVVVAAVIAIASTANVRLKPDATNATWERADYWFRLFLRFVLAAQMFYFGMAKVIPTQFPPAGLVTLLKPVGQLAPDDMLWTFIGTSVPYEMFTGWAEVVAGLLLLVPRTAMLGALIAFADMLQVWILNMTYDVGLKQTSFHLLLIALFLLGPQLKHIVGALIAGPDELDARSEGRAYGWDRGKRVWLQIGFGLYLLAMFTRIAMVSWENPGGPGAPKSPLYGIWDISSMSVDGETRPALFNDYDRRWRRVIFDTPDLMVFQRLDDSFTHYGASVDVDRRQIALRKIQSRLWRASFTFDRRDDDHMTIDGEMDDHKIHLDLQRLPMDVFRLTNGPFRWVRPPG
jgi:uncharacterized membrane protein YphA (DoxX/SURF4 family)